MPGVKIIVLGYTLHKPKTHKMVKIICDKGFSSQMCSILNQVSQKINICTLLAYSRVNMLVDPVNYEKIINKGLTLPKYS